VTSARANRWVPAILASVLGVFWVASGCWKLVQVWAGEEAWQQTWAAEFPALLIVAVSLMEIAVGATLCAGSGRKAVLCGIVLLAVFSVALSLWPPGPGQSCGCGPALGDSESVHLALVAFLMGVHALTWAVCDGPNTSHRCSV